MFFCKQTIIGMMGLLASFCISAACTSTADEYTSDFDSLNSSMFGVSLTGQDNYYIPAGTSSVDFNVYDYTDNVLAINQNPNGGSRFIAGEGPGTGTFARAQRDLTFSSGVVDVMYDMAALFTGVAPATNNIGSFSSRAGGGFGYIHLMTWQDTATATNFQADYIGFLADGTQMTFPTPGTGFDNLDLNHWYKFTTRLDFNTNKIVRTTITDLTTGATFSEDLTDVYMVGGAMGGVAADGFRFFGGGGGSGNLTAWDNVSILDVQPIPEPTGFAVICLAGLRLLANRRRRSH